MPSDLADHLPEELSSITDHRVKRVDPGTGEACTVSLAYGLNYVFYTSQHAVATQDGFFDPLVDDDESVRVPELLDSTKRMLPEATDVRKIQPRGEQIGSTGYFRPTTATDAALTTGRETGRCTTRANTQALEIIELIRCHRPHLLGAYLSQNGPSGRIPTRLRELPSRTDNAAPPAKRPRLAFSPSAEQERMHQLLTSTQHAVCMAPGYAGERIRPFGLDTMACQSLNSDAWERSTSIGPISAGCDFVTELEGWGQLAEGDLSMLVWRINKVLEKYRNAASHDLDSARKYTSTFYPKGAAAQKTQQNARFKTDFTSDLPRYRRAYVSTSQKRWVVCVNGRRKPGEPAGPTTAASVFGAPRKRAGATARSVGRVGIGRYSVRDVQYKTHYRTIVVSVFV
ncbi:hypothetical protein GN244_ATG12041 [Phytophthora infestans]|uniref:Uncharacterized protein n=1 Tax=Phytophthora infestans TaxID=4787 RepID=A0A833SZ88_PHYIN|nr:hypothetical protein GN244_ATG12041 [Phytophthora infestans]